MSHTRKHTGALAKHTSEVPDLRMADVARNRTMRIEPLAQSKRRTGYPSPKPAPRSLRLRELEPVAILLRHRGLITRCVLIAGLLGALVAWFLPLSYTARTSVIVGGGLGQVATISARGDAQNYSERTQELQARNARLMAEINGSSELRFPAELEQNKDRPALAKILEGERMLFVSRRQSLLENIDKLKAEHTLLEDRGKLLTKQVDLIAKQREISDKEVSETQALVDRKLAPVPRLREAQRASALLASRNVEVETELLRTRQNLNEVNQKITAEKTKYRTEAIDEQAKVQAEIREMSTKSNISRSIAETSGSDSRADAGFIANQADVITSDQLVRETVKRLGLEFDTTFITKAAEEGLPLKTAEEKLNAVVSVVQQSLTAGRVGPGSRIDIRFTWAKPAKAVDVTNTLARVYVENQAQAEYLPSVSVLRAASLPLKPDIGRAMIIAGALLAGLIAGFALALLLDR
jgi:hypothetical protein